MNPIRWWRHITRQTVVRHKPTKRRTKRKRSSSTRQKPPVGVATPARLHLLGEVARGRVLWHADQGEAWWLTPGGGRADVSGLFGDLRRAKWAVVETPDPLQDPPPQVLLCQITSAGEDRLIAAASRSRKTGQGARRKPARRVVEW